MRTQSYVLLIVAALAAGCAKQPAPVAVEYATISASWEEDDGDTKTYLTGVRVKWQETDSIALAYGQLGSSMAIEPYFVESIDLKDARKATFEGYAPVSADYIGVYPHGALLGCNPAGELRMAFPTVQKAAAGSFGPEANVAVAYSATTDLSFKNVGGLLAIALTDFGEHTITSVRLTGTSAMSGTVTLLKDTLPVVESVEDGVNYVELHGTFVEGGTYYFVVLPGSHEGFTLTLTDADGYTAIATSHYPFTIDRRSNTFIADLSVPEEKWQMP